MGARNAVGAIGLAALASVLSSPGRAVGQRLRITSPHAGTVLRGDAAVSVRASGLPAGATVEVFAGARRVVGPRRTIASAVDWNTRTLLDGRFAMRAIARDARGRVVASSPAVGVTVSNNPGGTAPVLRLVSPAESESLAGRVPFLFEADGDFAVALVVDGHDVDRLWHTPARIEFDTTQLADGEHEVTATAFFGRGLADFVPVAMVQRIVRVANGHAPRALRHAFSEVYVAPGEGLAPSWSLVRCDGASENAPADTAFESSDAAVVAVDASGGLRAVAPGEASVRARWHDRVGEVRVIVDADRSLPHFARDGEILHEYRPGRSAFVRAMFELGPLALEQNPGLGPEVRAAAINTLTTSLYSNPVHGGAITFQQWCDAWDSRVWAPVERAAHALDASVLLVGDDVARTAPELWDTLSRPWAADALAHALERARDLHRVVGIEMIDEASFAYGPSPRPTPGLWSHRDPPLPDDAIARVMAMINRVPGRPNVTWPVGGLGDPRVSHAWMGDPAFSDYASQYWTFHRAWRRAYPYGASLPQDREGIDDTVLARSYDRFRHIPQLLGVSVTGEDYRKLGEGDVFVPGRDELRAPATRPEEVGAQIVYALARGMAGVRAYTFDGQNTEVRARHVATAGAEVQTGAEPFRVGTDRWHAMASAFHLAALLEPWAFGLRASAPDLGSDVVTGAREGARGRAVFAVNFSERDEPVRLNLAAYATAAGARVLRYRLLGAALRTENLPADAPDEITLAPGEGVVWCFPGDGVLPPGVVLTSPAPDVTLAPTPEISLAADVAGAAARVSYFVDSAFAGDATAPPYAVTFAAAGLARGVWHGVTVVATDAAGNTSEARGAFRVEP